MKTWILFLLSKLFMANLIQQSVMEDSFSLSLKAIKNDNSSAQAYDNRLNLVFFPKNKQAVVYTDNCRPILYNLKAQFHLQR